MTTPDDPIAFTIRNGVAYARLCRAEQRNALSVELLDRLLAALREADRDPTCRAFVLAADGADFCCGALFDSPGAPDPSSAESLWALLCTLTETCLLTVATVHGAVTAGGVGLTSACDVVVAGPNASFRLTELLLGIVPAIIMPFVTARTGERGFRGLALSAEKLDVAEAQRIGLVDKVLRDTTDPLGPILRVASRRAIGDLKACQRLLHPLPDGFVDGARGASDRGAADPAVRTRITLLRNEGLLP